MNEMLNQLGQQAKESSKTLKSASSQDKNQALQAMADSLREQTEDILSANQKDVDQAVKNNTSPTMIDRLRLSAERINNMASSLEDLIQLEDPIGKVESMWTAESGIRIGKQIVPLGVVGIIYEARPNVTSDAAGICFKSGNAVILRGGKEAFESNKAVIKALHQGLKTTPFPPQVVQFIEDTTREVTTEFMKLNQYLDLLIPRGGAGLIQAVVEHASVPVIETGTGNVHVYVDASANIDMAVDIVVNAKTDRPSVCNAAESVLVHKDIAPDFLPALEKALSPHQVELRAEKTANKFLSNTIEASEDDFSTEFLALILAVKTVNSLDEAIDHINHYSTGHSESIVTSDYTSSQRFLQEVDSAAVYVNASTRFTDGGEFGFGAEIGISTQKLHARGPMGVQELTSNKFVIYGDGQIK